MTPAALAALLCTLAVLTAARTIRRPPLRPAALALAILAAADAARPWTYQRTPRIDIALSLLWPTASAWLITGPVALAWVAYAIGLALWGRHVAAYWQAALMLPRFAIGVLGTISALRARPWTPSQRIGLILAAGQVSAVAAGMWTTWDHVRTLAAVVYLWIGIEVARV